MKAHLAPRILAVPLFIALFAAPAIIQEGLISLWAPWGLPLLAAAVVFAALAGVMRGAWALGGHLLLARKAKDGSQPAAADERAPAGEEGEGEGTVDDGEEEEEEKEEIKPDLVLSEALNELEPENFMDLVRALQEMGRHGDALEVLARVAELKEGDYGEEVARALRRMRHQLGQGLSPGALSSQ